MTAALPRKVAFRAEYTGSAAGDRAQRQAQSAVAAHEQTKSIVAAMMNRSYVTLAANTTTSLTTYVTLLTTTLTTTLASGSLDVRFSVSGAHTTLAANGYFLVLVDGVAQKGLLAYSAAGQGFNGSMVQRIAVTRAPHTVTLQWKVDAGTARINASTVATEHAHLLVQEAV